MNSPKSLYRRLAIAEMVTWALLLFGLVLKYVTKTTELASTIFGGIHGFVFLSYAAVTIIVWINQRWSVARGILGLASSIIPFMTVPFERATEKAGLLDGPWRFTDLNEKPRGIFETILATIVRRPGFSAAIIAAVVMIVFVLLLLAGPPTQWFA
ncbi:DUF3817 domain-containing protein [Corynebacterium sp. H78]|uniref:DUF3817 domain-containing protein n=1 Tax=Corynebacterium sp. H78 TaxID=3133417 RepID=UPI00309A0E7C